MTLNIVFAIAFFSVVVYLVLFFRFTQRFPKLYPDLWESLNCPESFGLRGQATYLAVVLGLEQKVPLRGLQEVRGEVVAIRVVLAFTAVAFIAVAVMTG